MLQKSVVGRDASSVQGLLSLPWEQLSVFPNWRLRPWASNKIILLEISWHFHLPFETPTFYGPFCPLPYTLFLLFHLLLLLPDSQQRSSPFSPEVAEVHPHIFNCPAVSMMYLGFFHIGGSFQGPLVPSHLPDLWSPKASSRLCNNSTLSLFTILTYLSLFL